MVYNENRSQLEKLIMNYRHTLLAGMMALAPLTLAQAADAPADNYTEINLAVTDDQVIPRYAAFATASATLEQVAENFCATPGAGSLEALRVGFHDSMDAWQLIQHVQFGPITYFNWNFRLQYWPDENGTGARQLDALIAGKNTDALDSESFARESVGVQGFPALERLLFADDTLAAMQADPFRCDVAMTIARNISQIATGVYQRWTDEFRTTIASADERGFFESAEDATIDFMKSQIEPVRRIQQQKLEDVIGESASAVRVRRAESWRSARSLKNLKLNVQALDTLFNGSGDVLALNTMLLDTDVATINEKFADLHTTLDALPDGLEAALEAPDGYARLQQVVAGLDAVFEALEAALKNTDLYLGFNSLDGD